MVIFLALFIFITAVLLRIFSVAGLVLIFLCMKVCFDIMAYRNKRESDQAQENEAIRLANMDQQKTIVNQESGISLTNLMRKVR
ncbi:hypothetical protein ACFL54_08550 [Planctomycetota bacterium]